VGPPAQGDPADRPVPVARVALRVPVARAAQVDRLTPGDPAARAESARATDSRSGSADSPGGSGRRAARAEHPAPVAPAGPAVAVPADPVVAGRAARAVVGRAGQAADPGDSAGSRSAHHAQVAHDVPNARSCPRSR